MSIDTEIWHITPVGGNVFLDLGFPPAEAAKLKAESGLMIELDSRIRENRLTLEQAQHLRRLLELWE